MRRPGRRYCGVSHAFRESADFFACGAEPRIPRAFAGAEIGDRQNRACRGGFVRPVSNADFPISGIARQGKARPVCSSIETGSHSGGYGGRGAPTLRWRVRGFAALVGQERESDDAELLFLFSPGQRKVTREPG